MIRELPRNWQHFDAWVVVGLSIFALFTTVPLALIEQSPFKVSLISQLSGTALLLFPLLLRRRFPLTVTALVHSLYIVLPYTIGLDLFSAQIALFLSFYTVGAWPAQRVRAFVLRLGICIVMFSWMLLSILFSLDPVASAESRNAMTAQQLLALFLFQLSINVVFFAGSWVFGDRSWQQAIEQEQLRQAHAEIKELQDDLINQAISKERLHIARELHDVIAHHVTLMGVQSGAARLLLQRNPAKAAEALKKVEAEARQAVKELRNLVIILREGEPNSTELPTLADVERIVSEADSELRQVSFELIGDPPELSPVAELTIFRIAQEALTNATKHAGPRANVAVRLRNRDNCVELEISDDGVGSPSSIPGTGTGLIGMRERVKALGGTLEAGPKPLGGFRVRAEIPLGQPQ